jgi:hypothetical protein
MRENKREPRYLIEDADGFMLSLTEAQLKIYQANKGKLVPPKNDYAKMADDMVKMLHETAKE